MTRNLQRRVIIVLGGSKGIGLATARAAAEAGAHVVVGGPYAPNGSALKGIEDRVRYHAADVTDLRSLEELRRETCARFGHIDVVVNCAATLAPGPFASQGIDVIRRQFDVNAVGTVYVTKVFLPLFKAQLSGHFIHLASLGGIVPLPYSAVYAATKFAVRGFCLSIAPEVAPFGIDVTVVCPDSVATDQLLTEATGDGAPLSFASRPMAPSMVADAILDVIRKPRREVCIPGRKTLPAKLAGASGLVYKLAYPLLTAIGTRARDRWAKGAIRERVRVDGVRS